VIFENDCVKLYADEEKRATWLALLAEQNIVRLPPLDFTASQAPHEVVHIPVSSKLPNGCVFPFSSHFVCYLSGLRASVADAPVAEAGGSVLSAAVTPREAVGMGFGSRRGTGTHDAGASAARLEEQRRIGEALEQRFVSDELGVQLANVPHTRLVLHLLNDVVRFEAHRLGLHRHGEHLQEHLVDAVVAFLVQAAQETASGA